MNFENILKDGLGPISKLDWNNLTEVASVTHPFLDQIATTPGVLKELFERLERSEDLLSLCEREQSIERYILYDNPELSFRIRLHVITPGMESISHSHRRSFTSRILSGSYIHVVYNQQHDGKSKIDITDLETRVINSLIPGDTSTLDHRSIHTIHVTDSPSISLVIRGPAMKEVGWEADMETGIEWEHRTSSLIPDSSRVTDVVPLNIEDVRRTVNILHDKGVF